MFKKWLNFWKAQKVYLLNHNRFFDASTPAQFKAFGVEVEFDYFTYEAATGYNSVVIRATRKTGGWFELILDRENVKSWRCDGETIKEDMLDQIK